MAINFGENPIQDAKVGETQVEKIYLGEEEVWSNTPPTPPEPIKALKFSCAETNSLVFNTDRLGEMTPNIEYSLDNGATWTTLTTLTTPLAFGNGTDLYIRGMNNVLSYNEAYYVLKVTFSSNNLVDCSGNIMHLFDYTQDLTEFPNYSGTSGVGGMFNGCTALHTPPDLPATTLVGSCYVDLFRGCSNLIVPPKLPATTLTTSCYRWMFRGCSNLEKLPLLPATTLTATCYAQMFYGCSKIKMSETEEGEYVNEFPLPSSYTSSRVTEMFTNTGGTFTGTPSASMYYTSNEVIS